jgi:hypothetical protein
VSATRAAQVLYRKPKFAGYFDSSYTFSEALHQVQNNGVTNLSCSLAVAGGTVTKWGVGAGYGYSSQTQTSSAQTARTVYITTSFLLPKIELSFDYLTPCASDEFVNAITQALAVDQGGEGSYRRLLAVLRSFGQFVATRMTLGGKLYATQTKILAANESASDVTTRHAAHAKVAVESRMVNVESEVKFEKSDREQKKDESTDESQKMSFSAVGGEGAVLRNAGVWANSLADFRRWGTITYDTPIASITLLPEDLKQQCVRALRARAERSTVRQLIEDNAYFLFYGDYGDLVGKYARRVEFVIRNALDGRVLNLAQDLPLDGCPVQLWSQQGWDKQVWYMTPEGHIVNRMSRNNAEFALCLSATGELIVGQKDRHPDQLWEFTGSGQLVNLARKNAPPSGTTPGAEQVLEARGSQVLLQPKSATPVPSQLWDFVEVAPALLPVGAVAQPSPAASAAPATTEAVTNTTASAETPLARGSDTWFTIARPNGVVWGLRDMEFGTPRSGTCVVLQADLGQDHQLWRWNAAGQLVNKRVSQEGTELFLTRADALDGELTVQHGDEDKRARQLWDIRREGHVCSTKDNAAVTPNSSRATQGCALKLAPLGQDERQAWVRAPAAAGRTNPTFSDVKQTGDTWGASILTRVDSEMLEFNGEIRGAEFIHLWSEKQNIFSNTEACFSVKLKIRDASGNETWVENPNRDADRGDRLHIGDGSYADTNVVYFVGKRPSGFKMVMKNNRVAPAVRLDGVGLVFNEDFHNDNYFGDLENLNAMGGPVLVPEDREVVGIGLFEGTRQSIGLRLVLRPR